MLFSFSLPDSIPKGPGWWHLNASILLDSGFRSLIVDFWSDWKNRKSSFDSLRSWWDLGKVKFKSLAVRFCNQKFIERNASKSLLTNLSQHLKSPIDRGVTSCIEVYQNVLSQIADLDLLAAKGSQIRSPIRWAEDGESSSSFFFRLEKKRGTESWISAIKNNLGNIVSGIDEICSVWRSFYERLFTAEPTDFQVSSSLLSNIDATLSENQALLCDGLLTSDEVLCALKGMARNRSPGSDGLPVEFYLRFWDVIGSDLTDVFNEAFQMGSLSESQKHGLISLIFKKGDRLDCKNWRPITLLNVDYKLCARSLAGRLLKVLEFVVASDQTCGVPGRYIGENAAFLRDVVSYASETNCPLAILSLDQEKAFDRVDWTFLYSTLSAMKFGPPFINWVRLLYTDISSSVLVSGYQT